MEFLVDLATGLVQLALAVSTIALGVYIGIKAFTYKALILDVKKIEK